MKFSKVKVDSVLFYYKSIFSEPLAGSLEDNVQFFKDSASVSYRGSEASKTGIQFLKFMKELTMKADFPCMEENSLDQVIRIHRPNYISSTVEEKLLKLAPGI